MFLKVRGACAQHRTTYHPSQPVKPASQASFNGARRGGEYRGEGGEGRRDLGGSAPGRESRGGVPSRRGEGSAGGKCTWMGVAVTSVSACQYREGGLDAGWGNTPDMASFRHVHVQCGHLLFACHSSAGGGPGGQAGRTRRGLRRGRRKGLRLVR